MYFLRTFVYSANVFINILIAKWWLLSAIVVLWYLSFVTIRKFWRFYPVCLGLHYLYLCWFLVFVGHWMLLSQILLFYFPKHLICHERVYHFCRVILWSESLPLIFCIPTMILLPWCLVCLMCYFLQKLLTILQKILLALFMFSWLFCLSVFFWR